MKQSKKLGAGLVALALPTMMFALSLVGANAATVSSSVDAIDLCTWEISQEDVALSLTAGVDVKYVGDALAVSGTWSNLSLGFTGSLATATGTGEDAVESTACSFYNDIKKNKITATLASRTGTGKDEAGADITSAEMGQVFEASYGASADAVNTYTPDETMNFEISTDRPLVLAGSESVGRDCNAAFTTPADFSFTAVTAPSDAIVNSGTLLNKYEDAANIRCTGDYAVSINVKAATEVPAGPGLVYSFAGPVVVFALSPSAQ